MRRILSSLPERRCLLLFLLLIALSVSSAAFAGAPAGDTAKPATVPSATATWSRSLRLQGFMAKPAPITLHNTFDSTDISIPLASRLDVTGAKLHLAFTNSAALLARRSQLRVLVNDAEVAQVSLDPSQPDVRADVTIPPALLKYGFNTLTFDAAQHYTNDCENPGAPELWTQIDTAKSSIAMTGHLLPLHPKLSDLGELLGPAIGDTEHFMLLTPNPKLDDRELRWGALLAEVIGLHLQYTPAQITWAVARPVANATTPQLDESGIVGHDAVIFGTRAELAPLLSPAIIGGIKNSFLGIYPLASDPTHFLLVVSGETPDQVTRAAVALSLMNSPLADAPTALIDKLSLHGSAFFYPNNRLHQGQTYTFANLGFRTSTLKGSSPVRYKLHFTLAPDLYTPQSANVRFALNFAYGANLRSDSVLNIYLNGKFNQAIRLNNPNGAVYRNYDIYMPLRDFAPGDNTLTFEAVMVPLITSMSGQCATSQSNNLLFTLFDTSRLFLPPAQHYTAQPALGLFARTGFPNNGTDFGRGTAFRVAGHSQETVSAAWTLMARLAQVDDHALPLADVAFAGTPSDRNVIVVGAVPDLSPEILKAAPINVSTSATALSYPTNAPSNADSGVLQSLEELVAQGNQGSAVPSEGVTGQVSLGNSGIVEAMESPWARKRTMTVFTADRPEVLLKRIRDLVGPAYWYQLAGDVAVWKPSDKTMFTESVGPVFHVGHLDVVNLARYYLSAYPWYWIGALLGLGLTLALAMRVWTVRRRRRNFPAADDADI